MRLAAGAAVLQVEPADGGRWTSLEIGGRELLTAVDVAGGWAPTLRGCFAMAPFAGRLREGRLTWRGVEHRLPQHAPPHAVHGTAVDAAWSVVDASTSTAVLQHELSAPWPFAGTVRQALRLSDDGLDAVLSLHADDEQPVTLGFHPWFRRQLDEGGPVGLHFSPAAQYLRGPDGLPTGELVPPQEGPHDDCFVGVPTPVHLVWPDALELALTSSADHWVLFDERPEAVCVEPQTGPPDAVHLDRVDVVPAGSSLELRFSLRWTPLPARRV